MSDVIDISIVDKLKQIGFTQLSRAMIFEDIIIGNDFLESKAMLVNYLGKMSFNPINPDSKRKKAQKVASIIMRCI